MINSAASAASQIPDIKLQQINGFWSFLGSVLKQLSPHARKTCFVGLLYKESYRRCLTSAEWIESRSCRHMPGSVLHSLRITSMHLHSPGPQNTKIERFCTFIREYSLAVYCPSFFAGAGRGPGPGPAKKHGKCVFVQTGFQTIGPKHVCVMHLLTIFSRMCGR